MYTHGSEKQTGKSKNKQADLQMEQQLVHRVLLVSEKVEPFPVDNYVKNAVLT